MQKVSVHFNGLAALEKEIAENIKKGAISFVAEQTYPPGQELLLEVFVEDHKLGEFQVKVLFSQDGFHGCTLRRFDQQQYTRFCWEVEKLKAGLHSDLFSSQPVFKETTAPAADPGLPPRGMTADELFANFSSQAQFAASDETGEPSYARAQVKSSPTGKFVVVEEAPAEEKKTPTQPETPRVQAAASAEVIEARPLADEPKPTFVLGQGSSGKIRNGPGMELSPALSEVQAALRQRRSLTVPFHHLYLALVKGEMSGLLQLRYTGRNKEFTFFGGAPVSYKAEPKMPKEALPTVLLSLKLLDRHQFLQAFESHNRSRRPLTDLLLEMKLLDQAKLRYGQEMQTTVLFQDMFEVEEAQYTWLAGQFGVPPKPLEVRPLGVAFRGLVRIIARCGEAAQKSFVERYKGMYPQTGGKLTAADLQLEEREEKLWAMLVEGRRSLREIVECSPYDRADTWPRLMAFQAVGAMECRETLCPVPPAAVDPRIREILEAAEGLNYFELLGLHMSSPSYQYEPAIQKKREELKKMLAGVSADPALKTAAEKYRQRLEEAFRTLGSETLRVAYRLKTFGEGTCRFQSETLTKKGQLALFRNDTREAFDCFTSALELHPKNSEARQGLAEARRRGGKAPQKK